jgi:hypothetical protein
MNYIQNTKQNERDEHSDDDDNLFSFWRNILMAKYEISTNRSVERKNVYRNEKGAKHKKTTSVIKWTIN